jgi:hypothetical protein
MTSYTLNDPTKLWGITASTIAPKTSGTLAVTATTVSAPVGSTLTVNANTVNSTDIFATTIDANIIEPNGINGSLNIIANSISPPISTNNLVVKATSVEPPDNRSFTVLPTGTGEIIFSKNYIVVNSTKIYFQSTDPGAVGAGSIWFDLP